MKKALQLTFACLFLVQVGFSQQLQNTQWTAIWGAPINDDVSFSFGADTLFITGSTGNEIITTLYSENGSTMTVQDVSGPFSCPSSDIGIYQFVITGSGGTVLNFTLDSDSCIGRSSFITSDSLTTKSTVGIAERAPVSFNIYPNPVADLLTVQAKGNHEVLLYSILGKRVLETVITNEIKIDCTAYPKGIYFVKVGGTTKKLILD